MKPLVSILIITHNRREELRDTVENVLKQSYSPVEVMVLENGSDFEVVTAHRADLTAFPRAQYFVEDENLGVSGGRNVLLQKARGDYVIEIDDDAVFEKDDAIEQAIEHLESHPRVGILAFRITNYFSRRIVSGEFPFRSNSRDPETMGVCTWFIGAGHCFRRQVMDRIGLYRDFFPWGSEEQDFSLRAMDAGFDIVYFPAVNVLHKKAPTGRMSNASDFGAIALKNRTKFAMLNLPVLNAVTYFLVRSLQSTLLYKDPRVPFKAVGHLRREWGYIREHRKVVGRDTLKRLSALNGQLYY